MKTFYRVCNVETGEDFFGFSYKNNISPKFSKKIKLFSKLPTQTLVNYHLNMPCNISWPPIEIVRVEIFDVEKIPDTTMDFSHLKLFFEAIFNLEYWTIQGSSIAKFLKMCVVSQYEFRYILEIKGSHKIPTAIKNSCKVFNGVSYLTGHCAAPFSQIPGNGGWGEVTYIAVNTDADVTYAKMYFGFEVLTVYDYINVTCVYKSDDYGNII